MKILEYSGLDHARCRKQYEKIVAAIERDDFRSAEVKKLANLSHGKFFRARLDHANRLLFTVVRHGASTYALMLEIIENHAYDKSRFLRGAVVDEDKIPLVDASAAAREAEDARYIHPERREIHLLDKVISFDDTQEAVYRLHPPLVVVGSAGSGKTALTLEKMKHAEGEVLYVTHSAFLAQGARDLYYAHGFEREGQEATFFSYREFLESLRVPAGREALWRDFAGWFTRMRQQFKGIEAHQAFEEIRGVITAEAGGVLARAAYLELGVRQSIFAVGERARIYDLFEKYRAWLAESRLYDLNLVAHAWSELATPRYDFVVVDEVQDLTNAQLALVLKTLRKPGHFLLCGDSNQIVHPNFFSWSKVKSLFWRDPALAERQELKVLRANFRNGREATRIANALLKVKHRRFGSIDRESNFLVEAIASEDGQVSLLRDKDAVKADLNQKTKGSTQFAVLVMRDEDKPDARRHFQTPLVFSIHEAKGLEYENIILHRFISDHRAEFAAITEGVTAADLAGDALDYHRARDKHDKSLEIYKFYVNALYVALTRAIRNVYLVESDLAHPLLGLLGIGADSAEQVRVQAKASSLDDWQREARKLELQGKQEQADAIRQEILKQKPVPWPVFDEDRVRELLVKVFREQVPGSKFKQQLYEYAAVYDDAMLAGYLVKEAHFDAAKHFDKQRPTLNQKHLQSYQSRHFKDVLRQCDLHGLEHRTSMNLTPLIAAVAAGNVALVEALLERGADPGSTDHLGRTALHWALLGAFDDKKYARTALAPLYELIAPATIDFKVGERLVRIDRHLSEYLLVQSLWALFKSRFHVLSWRERSAFDTATLLDAWQHLPPNVLKPERHRRSFLSGVLSRNEVERDYAYNRHLFKRVVIGWYQFNPDLAVRRKAADGETWQSVFVALNLAWIKEFSEPRHWVEIDSRLAQSGCRPAGTPIAAERQVAAAQREAAARREHEALMAKLRDREIRPRVASQRFRGRASVPAETKPAPPPVNDRDDAPSQPQEQPAPWGTPRARQQALKKLQRQIEENRLREAREKATREKPE
ncbi:MAG: AAA family ATPase [Thiotrichales bacterium]